MNWFFSVLGFNNLIILTILVRQKLFMQEIYYLYLKSLSLSETKKTWFNLSEINLNEIERIKDLFH